LCLRQNGAQIVEELPLGQQRLKNSLCKENTKHPLKDKSLDTPAPGKHRLSEEEVKMGKLEQKRCGKLDFPSSPKTQTKSSRAQHSRKGQ